MAFLTGYVLPKAYYEKVGAEGFEKKPIGTGPYMVDEYQGNAFLRLKANPKYWGGKPAFETVVFKFVPDATSRVAEIESGSSDMTLEVPYEEYDRLEARPGLAGRGDADLRHRHDLHHQCRADARQERAPGDVPRRRQGSDHQAAAARLWRCRIDTLEAPEYAAFDPSIKVAHDPKMAAELLAASGYSKEKPVKFTIQTTRGFKPKDYEMIQAIVGMWRNVGIDANIEVYEIAKHFELRMSPQARAGGVLQLGQRDRRSDDLDRLRHVLPVAALGLEDGRSRRQDRPAVGREGRGQAHRRLEGGRQIYRRAGLRDAAAAIFQPIVYKADLKVTPNTSGALQPATLVSKA